MTLEEWRPVVGWEGLYEVSDQGRVRSVARLVPHPRGGLKRVRQRVLAVHKGRKNYLDIKLQRGAEKSTQPVHRLVAYAFLGERPVGYHICHNNGDATDNRVANLRYDTPSANVRDTVIHGHHPKRERTHCPQGHPYDSENTHYYPNGHRRCRECHRTRERTRRKAASR